MSFSRQTSNSLDNVFERINCFECEYLFITHDKNRRYGCNKFGFKGPNLPSNTVFASTGTKCAYFKLKKRLENNKSSSNQSRGRE